MAERDPGECGTLSRLIPVCAVVACLHVFFAEILAWAGGGGAELWFSSVWWYVWWYVCVLCLCHRLIFQFTAHPPTLI